MSSPGKLSNCGVATSDVSGMFPAPMHAESCCGSGSVEIGQANRLQTTNRRLFIRLQVSSKPTMPVPGPLRGRNHVELLIQCLQHHSRFLQKRSLAVAAALTDGPAKYGALSRPVWQFSPKIWKPTTPGTPNQTCTFRLLRHHSVWRYSTMLQLPPQGTVSRPRTTQQWLCAVPAPILSEFSISVTSFGKREQWVDALVHNRQMLEILAGTASTFRQTRSVP